MKILSLGAGVQSSTLALMMEAGEIDKPDCAIFADTGAEPQAVYDWLDVLETKLSYPVHRVSAGNIYDDIVNAADGVTKWADGKPPYFVKNGDGSTGMTRRQCTSDYKMTPIYRKIRALVGLAPYERYKLDHPVFQYIGISLDECSRAKPNKVHWIANMFPLVERRLTRNHCLKWLKEHNIPIPQKSACVFCPYHSDETWRELKENSPKDFKKAVFIDNKIRNGINADAAFKGTVYLHRSCKPLEKIDFRTAADYGQVDMFENECEGMCGV